MTTTELLALLVRADLAASLAILLVLALRLPARSLFGARLAYGLWLLVPIAFLANLVPGPEATLLAGEPPAVATLSARLTADLEGPILALWLVGVVVGLGVVAWSQLRFMSQVAQGRAGPAVVGVFAPRMVVPADHHERYSLPERALVRAHERAHIDRGDPAVNGLIALAQCLSWFNPLVHLAARCARIDQELACDATVLARHPRARKRYAATMLKIQLAPAALPLGCHWTAHPLETRVAMLAAPGLSDRREAAGGFALAALSLLAAYGAWSAQPERPPLHQPIYFERYPTVTWRCWPSSPDPATNRCARTIVSDTAPDNVVLTVNLRPSNETIVLPPRRLGQAL